MDEDLRHTHALLLSSMVPYSQISFQDHLQIITAHEHRTPSNVTLSSALSFDILEKSIYKMLFCCLFANIDFIFLFLRDMLYFTYIQPMFISRAYVCTTYIPLISSNTQTKLGLPASEISLISYENSSI